MQIIYVYIFIFILEAGYYSKWAKGCYTLSYSSYFKTPKKNVNSAWKLRKRFYIYFISSSSFCRYFFKDRLQKFHIWASSIKADMYIFFFWRENNLDVDFPGDFWWELFFGELIIRRWLSYTEMCKGRKFFLS